MKIIIDRIEGDWAVLEVGEHRVNFPLAALPSDTKEGAVLTLSVAAPPEDVLQQGRERLERLRKRDPGGSFDI